MPQLDKRKFFSFPRTVLSAIGKRQQYRCAVCGRNLGAGNTTTLVNYHHVIPVQSANPADPGHAFVRSADNGVLVCDQSADESRSESCHGQIAHGGSRFTGFVAPPSRFPFSHGSDTAAHRTWARSLAQRSRSIWP